MISTVSKCRVTGLTIELPDSTCAAAVGLSTAFPALTSVSRPLWGRCGVNHGVKPWTAIYRADEEDSETLSLSSEGRGMGSLTQVALASRSRSNGVGWSRCGLLHSVLYAPGLYPGLPVSVVSCPPPQPRPDVHLAPHSLKRPWCSCCLTYQLGATSPMPRRSLLSPDGTSCRDHRTRCAPRPGRSGDSARLTEELRGGGGVRGGTPAGLTTLSRDRTGGRDGIADANR
jgi:hypothetical protein